LDSNAKRAVGWCKTVVDKNWTYLGVELSKYYEAIT
jgi:hypothetical protein